MMTVLNVAKFAIGQTILHRLFEYRGVVFDVDANFNGDEEWYESVALSRPPKDAPWYHILPDGAEHTTYVAERNLEDDLSNDAIEHPLLEILFDSSDDEGYVLHEVLN